MEIIGYKCFNKDMTNCYGMKFEVNKTYSVYGTIKFGTYGNGFHMCERMEDTLRYFDAMHDEVSLCMVKGSGEIAEYYDDYYGYYDMYAVEKLEILHKLERSEIISLASTFDHIRVKRFLSGFKLNSEEILMFKEIYQSYVDVIRVIEYYQENQLDAFKVKKKI